MNSSRALIIVNPIAGGGRARRVQPADRGLFARTTLAGRIRRLRRALRICGASLLRRSPAAIVAWPHLAATARFIIWPKRRLARSAILGFLPGRQWQRHRGRPRTSARSHRSGPCSRLRQAASDRCRSFPESRSECVQPSDARAQPSHEAIFVGAGGAGLDAEAAQLANTRFKRWPGVTRYIAGALWAWRDFRPLNSRRRSTAFLGEAARFCGGRQWSMLWLWRAHRSRSADG